MMLTWLISKFNCFQGLVLKRSLRGVNRLWSYSKNSHGDYANHSGYRGKPNSLDDINVRLSISCTISARNRLSFHTNVHSSTAHRASFSSLQDKDHWSRTFARAHTPWKDLFVEGLNKREAYMQTLKKVS